MQHDINSYCYRKRLMMAIALALPAIGFAADPPTAAPAPTPSAKPALAPAPNATPAPTPMVDTAQARKDLDQLREQMKEMTRKMAQLSAQLGDVGPRSYAYQYMGDPDRGMVGIVFSRSDKGGEPTLTISAVTPGGPADKAGFKHGDVIVSIDGKPIKKEGNIQNQLRDVKAGQTVKFGIARDGKNMDIAVKAERREPYNFSFVIDDEAMKKAYAEDLKSLKNLSELKDLKVLQGMQGYAYAYGDDDDAERVREQVQRATELAQEAAQRAAEHASEANKRAAEHAQEAAERAQANAERAAERAVERSKHTLGHLNVSVPWWGLNLTGINPDLGSYFGADRGALVLSTDEAYKVLKPGDVLLDIDGHRIERPEDAMRRLREGAPGSEMKLQVMRQHKTLTLSMKTPDFNSIFVPVPPAPPAPPPPPPPPPVAPVPAVPAPPAPPRAPTAPAAPQVFTFVTPPTPPTANDDDHEGE